MNITGTSSYIILDMDGRKIKAQGERVIGGFYAEIKSMQQFEPPHEKTPLTDEIKRQYMDEAIKKNGRLTNGDPFRLIAIALCCHIRQEFSENKCLLAFPDIN